MIRRYNAGIATDEEKAFIDAYYSYFDKDPQAIDHTIGEEMRAYILAHATAGHKVRSLRPWYRYAAAASILIFLGIGSYFFLHKRPVTQLTQNQQQPITPGHNQATLTLAGGQKIILTKGLSGRIATQGNTVIQATGKDIAYNSTSQEQKTVSYNTLTTARGEQSPFPLVLADGTKVWLNAASSITFPTAFQGNERIVKVTGEAYFEVVHNAKQPFTVQTFGETIEDIGTHFDVNAYGDEPVQKTTLIEGAVKVTAGGQSRMLTPGQQAAFSGSALTVAEVDAQQTTAWKDGYFYFDHADIKEVMRQISRWYKVEVKYEGKLPKKHFSGNIYRKVNLQQALKILAYFNVHFRIEDKTVIITT